MHKQCAICGRRPFQFTPLREGRRDGEYAMGGKLMKFQFTPLREGRHINEDAEKSLIDFNSRPSARGDSRKRVATQR